MADKEVITPASSFSEQGSINALEFFVRSMINGIVNTAIPVRVDSIERPAEGGGAAYLKATPLIQQRNAAGDALPCVPIPRLRWFRLQHGTAAIICDPKVGDIGLAVVAHQDVSNLDGGSEPQPPNSFRTFDLSDGFYIGGFWGSAPKTFIRIEDSGDVTITAPQAVTVNTKNATVNASVATVINTPKTTITGDTYIDKTLNVTGRITGAGGITVSGGSGGSSVRGNFKLEGSMSATGDVVAGGKSLMKHTHKGDSGGNTGVPN
ncbi:MAG: hypothetical protein KHY22_04020 [Sutterella wadsworthensis]|nr:hypothetical protein [Sutterella wadsworthensis]MDU5054391.1 hypothetical protein [Sutterella wadsworthensis]